MAQLKKAHLILMSVVLLNIESIFSHSQDFTLSAIDIDTNQVRFIKTETPLTITQSRRQTSNVINTGTTLITSTYEPELAKLYGGFLNDTYLFCQDEFYWNLKLKPNAGVKIDGKGSPVQGVLTFSKDGCKKIQNSVQIVVFVYVVPFSPAPSFGGFNSIVNRVTDAGSSTKGSEYDICLWFFSKFAKQRYYVYTASNGATVIVIPKLPLLISHKMSPSQFYGTFGKLKNSRGRSYSHTASLTTSSSAITSAKGIKIITTS